MALEEVSISCVRQYTWQRPFNYVGNSVKALYTRCLPRLDSGPVWKVMVEVVSGGEDCPPLEDMHDVVRVFKAFDGASFIAVTDPQRRRQVLDCLQSGLLEVARARQWHTQPFEIAYREVLARNIVNEEYVGKPARSPRGDQTAQILYHFGSDVVRLFVVIRGGDGVETFRCQFAETPPTGEARFQHLLGTVKWVGSDRVEVVSRDKKHRFECAVG
jgi:hypothetical protein